MEGPPLPVPASALAARRDGDGGLQVEEEQPEEPRLALIGVRSCDLRAIAVQDRTFVDGPYRTFHANAPAFRDQSRLHER